MSLPRARQQSRPHARRSSTAGERPTPHRASEQQRGHGAGPRDHRHGRDRRDGAAEDRQEHVRQAGAARQRRPRTPQHEGCLPACAV